MRRSLLILFLLPFCVSIAISQNIDHILLDTLYITTMDKVLDDISNRYKVRFAFDRELLGQIEINERPVKKPLSLFLTQECAARKLQWHQKEDSIIYIEEKYENLTSKPVIAEQKIEQKRTYSGPSKKKGFTLTGIVRDKSTGEALPFANVGVRGTPLGAYTSADVFLHF